MTPRVDVLLPFYGDPMLFRDAVESVLRQELEDFRMIVVDDAYPDPSVGEWVRAIRDERVSYHRNETNLGANRNYTKALGLATAPFTVVMGADDLMLPNYLDVTVDALTRDSSASIAQPAVQVIDEHGERVLPLVDRVKSRLRPPQGTLAGEAAIVSVLRGNWTYFPSLCWRTAAVQRLGFRPQFHVVQDIALIVDVLRTGTGLHVAPEIAFQYRRHAGSDSALKTVEGARFDEEQTYFRTIAAELEDDGMPRAARAARLHVTSRLHALALVPGTVRARNQVASRRLLRHALG